ncbi:MAG: hypothetical protein ACSLFQ_09795 [Thermoanaerobaculia bacterium]
MLKKFYILFCVAAIAVYGLSVLRGWEFPVAKKSISGPDVRSASGGNVYYRSGYRGGK